MEKLVLDQDKCIGCGACVGIAPESFEFDGGFSKVKDSTVTDAAISAKDACPTFAISVENEEKAEDIAA